MIIMDFIKSTFNNRELSIIIWMIIILSWLFSGSEVRRSFYAVIKSFFQKKIFYSVVAMIVYVAFIVYAMYKVGYWDTSMLKETLLWFLGGGFILHLNVNKINNDERFFKKFIIDTIKIAVLIEFIVNFYSFSLFVELILVPVLFIIGGVKAMAEGHHEYKDNEKYTVTRKFLNTTLSIVGYVLLFYFIFKITQDFEKFSNIQTLKVFFLPVFLSLSCLPIMYAMALIMLYETLFIQLSFRIYQNPKLVRYLNWKALLVCNFHLLRVRNFSKSFKSAYGFTNKNAVDYAVKRALINLRNSKES